MTAMLFFGGVKTAHASTLILPPNNINLVGYWSMNEGSGTVTADKSGSGNTGTLTNGPTWVDGKFGKAVSFDGVNDYVSTNYDFSGLTKFTIAGWFKRSTVSVASLYVSQSNAGNDWVQIGYASDGNLYIGGLNQVTASIASNDINWHHTVFIYDGTQSTDATKYTLYQDGVLQSPTFQLSGIPSSVPTITTNKFKLGTRDRNSIFGSGSIDDVRIYSRALSATEISRMYQQGSAKRASVNTTGLVGYWPMDENRGTTAKDKSLVGGNTGTLTNGPTWTTGKYGSAVSFDGTDDYVDIGNNLSIGSSLTMSAWVKRSAGSGIKTIFDINDDSNVCYLRIGEGTANAASFACSGSLSVTDTVSISDNNWHHVVGVKSGSSEARLYVDGVSVGTPDVSYTTATFTATNVQIGRELYGGTQYFPFDGSIDDVRIYNRALSATEVANLYAQNPVSATVTKINTSPVNVLTNGLVGYWTFDGPDISGTSATDRSGNANTGTLTNGPTPTQGRRGQALKFDGTNDYVGMGVHSNLFSERMSLSTWVKFNNISGQQHLAGKAFNTGYNQEYLMYKTDSTNLFGFTFNGDSPNSATATSVTPAVVGTWYHVVGTRDGTNVKIYVNGILEATTSYSFTPVDYGNAFNLGNFTSYLGGASWFFNGSIDDVRIYNRALSSSEVLQLYNAGK